MEEEGYLEIDIKQIARELLQNNKTIIRCIGEEKLNDVFEKIHILDTQEQFSEKCGCYSLSVDGFNEKDYICISPDATPYTIIREVLQYITSEFNHEGIRIKNGISYDGGIAHCLLNQGLLEYLATKISGEYITNQTNKKLFFERLEPMMISYTGNEDILLETLLNNQSTVHEFVKKFADRRAAAVILDSIRDSEVGQLDNSFKNMERKVKIQCIINKLKERIGESSSKKEIKTITSSKDDDQEPRTARDIFIERCNTTPLQVNKTTGIKPIPTTFDIEEIK